MCNSDLNTIFFDLGGVLVHVDHQKLYQNLALTSHSSFETILDLVQETQDLHLKFELGEIKADQFYQEIVARFPESHFLYDDFVQSWTDVFTINTKVLNLACKLSEDYRISIISNTDELHFNKIIEMFDNKLVLDNPTTSFLAKSRKPDKKIFRYALDKMDINPSDALFIDDRFENVVGGQKAGICSLQFFSYNDLKEDLIGIGIQFKQDC
jgi:putative hydrolase of the HAD superfamily